MDLIFHNGRVITVDNSRREAGAVAVRGNKIAAVGKDKEILALKSDRTTVVDLAGRTLLPGFNDSHMHLLGYALTAGKVDLRYCTGIDQIVAAIKEFIRDNEIARGQWVLGWGWDQSLFEVDTIPRRDDLDRAAPDHPVAVMRTCCHILAVNSAALKKAGIDKIPACVRGGEIETDARGVPTGVLKESAMELVTGLQPPPGRDKLKKLILQAAADFLAAGLTSVQTDDLACLEGQAAPLLIDVYRELESKGELPLRVNLQCLLPTLEELQSFLAHGYRTGQGGDYFKIGPLKLLVDGSFGGRTALLSTPYHDEPGTCGVAVLNRRLVQDLVNLACRKGLQTAVHAIGDAAIKMVLEVYGEAEKFCPRSDPRFRLIHAAMANQEILDSIKKQDVIADIQPSFIPSDYLLIDRHLGPERAAWTYPWKDFARAGIKMAGGSDCPVETYAPLKGIHAALTRQSESGSPPGGWYPAQRLSLDEALHIYTMGSAYCTYEEKIKGSISEGKLADLVVLSADLRTINPAQITDIKVDMTIVGGRIAYCRNKAAELGVLK